MEIKEDLDWWQMARGFCGGVMHLWEEQYQPLALNKMLTEKKTGTFYFSKPSKKSWYLLFCDNVLMKMDAEILNRCQLVGHSQVYSVLKSHTK